MTPQYSAVFLHSLKLDRENDSINSRSMNAKTQQWGYDISMFLTSRVGIREVLVQGEPIVVDRLHTSFNNLRGCLKGRSP